MVLIASRVLETRLSVLVFAGLFEQFNLSRIQTVVRSDDLHFSRLHARRDDWAAALQAFRNIASIRTDGIFNCIAGLAFRLFNGWRNGFQDIRDISCIRCP